jgi:hypothetical protein
LVPRSAFIALMTPFKTLGGWQYLTEVRLTNSPRASCYYVISYFPNLSH